jgi:gliding motility-associated-like protein
MTLRLLIFVLLLGNVNLSAQLLYYVSPINPNDPNPNTKFNFGVIDLSTCKDSTIFPIKPNDSLKRILDIAVCPDGNFYVSGSGDDSGRRVGILNLQDSSINILADIPVPTINSLTCDANGVLYGGSVWNLFTYDTKTGAIDTLGFLGYPLAGDMTFRNNKLYGTTSFNELIEIDTANPSASQVVFKYPLSDTLIALGVISDAKSCDSTTTYITVTNTLVAGITDTINEIYAIDPIAQTATFICETQGIIFGACSPTEFLASDCSVRLDLDADDSSGAPDSNYLALPLCADSTLVAAADTDATFYSGYRVDSIGIHLLLPAPDAPLEYLAAQASGSVSVSGQGSGWLTLSVATGTAVAAANADYQAVLRSVQWHNDAAPFTAGGRTVEFIAYAANGLRDTAYTFIPVPQSVSAGRDTAVAFCADAPPFDLASLLAADAALGGLWSPQTVAGNGVFSPQTDAGGAYNYLVSNGVCPADTAVVEVSVSPLPVFSLGSDTAFCAGETLTLSAPATAVWQDGTLAPTYTLNQSGIYWAEIADANGCRWRDSVAVTVNQPSVSQLFATSCFGKTYVWNGQSFTADTSVCVAFTAANGCDSLDCLNLSFFYPNLTLDTSICAGQTLTWLGKSFSQSGIYEDTLLSGGCLTAVVLNLAVTPAVEVSLSRHICTGDSLIFNGKTLAAPGVYTDTLLTADGLCDSVVTLALEVLPLPTPQIEAEAARVCAGTTTTLWLSGSYAEYVWSEGATSPTLEAGAGTYSLTVTDANGCRGTDTIVVGEFPSIAMTWDTASPLCHGQANGFIALDSVFGGVQPFVFQLNNGAPSSSAIFQNLGAGAWEVLVTDSAGCRTAFSFELQNPPSLALDLGESQWLKEGESYPIAVQISQSGQFSYAWSPPDGLSCTDCASPVATPLKTTTYVLFLENENGCAAQDSLTLRVLAAEPEVYAPNVFSPNDDGKNDFFTLFGNEEDFVQIESLQIYDRWGGLMFEGKMLPLNDEQRGWDGTWRGKKVPPGVFTWQAELRLTDGTLVQKAGEVAVVR